MLRLLLGTILLYLALVSLVGGLVAALLDIKGRDAVRRSIALRATGLGFGLMTLALLLLAAAFLVGELRIAYVWANVDLRYAWYQRLSGLWVGRSGSLLLWTFFTLGFWCIEELRHHVLLRRNKTAAATSARTANPPRRGAADESETRLLAAERVRAVARPALLLLASLMLLVVIADDPFAPATAEQLRAEPWGRGVNPQLIIPLNAIHPPIVFAGYALTAIPTAFALGHLATGADAWLGPARRWAHLAFFFLTLGVGLGGLWAYIALGWGGYWAWDPVEVGSLVPWLVTTVFLHAAYRADGKGEFAVAAPAFGFLMLAGSLFSTFVVRAGGVWVSLHSFLGPGASDDPWERFRTAFAAQPEVKLYTALLAALLVGVVVLVALQVRRIEAREASAATARTARATGALHQRLLSHVTLSSLFVTGVLLLALLTTVTVTLLFVGVNGFPSDRIREATFTERTGPIALTAVSIMAIAVSIGTLRKTQVLALLGGAVLVGIVAALVFRDVWALAMATPVLIVTAVLVAWRIALAWKNMERRSAIRFTGIHLVHLGVAVLLLGHGFVSTFEEVHPRAEFVVGETRDVGPYTVRLDSLTAIDSDDNGRLDHIIAHLHVWEGNEDLGMVTSGFQYYDFQAHYKPDVGLSKQGIKDVYFAPIGVHDPQQGWLFGNLPLFEQGALEAGAVDGFAVEVSSLPYIDLVWLGAGFMVLGAALLSFSSWTAWRPQRVPERLVGGAPATA